MLPLKIIEVNLDSQGVYWQYHKLPTPNSAINSVSRPDPGTQNRISDIPIPSIDKNFERIEELQNSLREAEFAVKDSKRINSQLQEEISRLKQRLVMMEQQAKQSAFDLASLSNENKTFTAKNSSYEQRISELITEVKRLNQELITVTNDRDSWRKECESKNSNVSEFQTSFNAFRKEMTRLLSVLSSKDIQENQNFDSLFRIFETEVRNLRDERDLLHSKLQAAQNSMNSLNNRFQDANGTIDLKIQENLRLSDEIMRLKLALADLKDQLSSQEGLKNQNESNQQKTLYLENTIIKLKEEIIRLTKNNEDIIRKFQESEERFTSANIPELRQSIELLKQQLYDSENNYRKSQSETIDLKNEISKKEIQIDFLKNQSNQYEKEITSLKQDFAKKIELLEINSNIKITDLNHELSDIKVKLLSSENELNILRQENISIKNKFNENTLLFKDQIDIKSEELQKTQNNNRMSILTLQQENEFLKSENESLKRKISDLKKDLEDIDASKLHDVITSLTLKLKNADSTIQSLSDKLNNNEKDYRRTISDLKLEIESSKTKAQQYLNDQYLKDQEKDYLKKQLDKNNQNLKQDLLRQSEEFQTLKNNLNSKISDLEQEILQQKSLKVQAERKAFENEQKLFEANVPELEKTISMLKTKLISTEEELRKAIELSENLKGEVIRKTTTLTQEVQFYKSENQEKQSEIKKLKIDLESVRENNMTNINLFKSENIAKNTQNEQTLKELRSMISNLESDVLFYKNEYEKLKLKLEQDSKLYSEQLKSKEIELKNFYEKENGKNRLLEETISSLKDQIRNLEMQVFEAEQKILSADVPKLNKLIQNFETKVKEQADIISNFQTDLNESRRDLAHQTSSLKLEIEKLKLKVKNDETFQQSLEAENLSLKESIKNEFSNLENQNKNSIIQYEKIIEFMKIKAESADKTEQILRADLDKIKNQYSQFEDNLKEQLQNKDLQSKQTIDNLKTKLSQIESELEENKTQKTEALKKIADLKNKLRETENNLSLQKEEVSKMKEQFNQNTILYHQELQKVSNEVNRLLQIEKETIPKLLIEIDDYSKAALLSEKKLAEADIPKLNETIARLNTLSEEAKTKIDNLIDENQKLKLNLLQKETNLIQKEGQLDQKNADLMSINNRLTKEIENANEAHTLNIQSLEKSFNDKLDSMEKESQNLKKMNETLENKLSDTQSELFKNKLLFQKQTDNFSEEVRNLEVKVRQMTELNSVSLKKLELENNALLEEKQSLMSKISELQNNIININAPSLNITIQSLQNKLNDADLNNKMLKDKISNLEEEKQKQFITLTKMNEELLSQIDSTQQEKTRLKDQLDEDSRLKENQFNSTIIDLRNQFSNEVQKINSFKLEAENRLEQEKKNFDFENRNLKRQIEDLRKEHESNIQFLTNQLQKAEEKASSHERKLRDIEYSANTQVNKSSIIEKSNQELKDTLITKDNEIADLRNKYQNLVSETERKFLKQEFDFNSKKQDFETQLNSLKTDISLEISKTKQASILEKESREKELSYWLESRSKDIELLLLEISKSIDDKKYSENRNLSDTNLKMNKLELLITNLLTSVRAQQLELARIKAELSVSTPSNEINQLNTKLKSQIRSLEQEIHLEKLSSEETKKSLEKNLQTSEQKLMEKQLEIDRLKDEIMIYTQQSMRHVEDNLYNDSPGVFDQSNDKPSLEIEQLTKALEEKSNEVIKLTRELSAIKQLKPDYLEHDDFNQFKLSIDNRKGKNTSNFPMIDNQNSNYESKELNRVKLELISKNKTIQELNQQISSLCHQTTDSDDSKDVSFARKIIDDFSNKLNIVEDHNNRLKSKLDFIQPRYTTLLQKYFLMEIELLRNINIRNSSHPNNSDSYGFQKSQSSYKVADLQSPLTSQNSNNQKIKGNFALYDIGDTSKEISSPIALQLNDEIIPISVNPFEPESETQNDCMIIHRERNELMKLVKFYRNSTDILEEKFKQLIVSKEEYVRKYLALQTQLNALGIKFNGNSENHIDIDIKVLTESLEFKALSADAVTKVVNSYGERSQQTRKVILDDMTPQRGDI